MIKSDIIIAIAITFGFIVTVFCIEKKKIKMDYMTELKLALLLAKMSFKDVKLQKIADIIMTIVVGLEQTKLSAQEKKAAAMKQAIKEIYDKTGINLDEATLSTIIDIAVAHMQKK